MSGALHRRTLLAGAGGAGHRRTLLADAGGAGHRRTLLAAAAAGIFMFGVVMALLGATLLPLAERVQISAARAGGLFLAMNFGIFVTLLISGPALDRFGTRPVLVASSALVAAGVALLARAGTIAEISVALLLIGLGGGGLNTGANALVSDAYAGERGPALNLLGVFFGFGAVALPFTIGTISRQFSLGAILGATAVLPAICAAAYLLLPFPPAREAHGFRLAEAARVARNPYVLLFAVLLFFQSGNEFTMGGWTATYIARETGASAEYATLALTGYWAALMVGRFVSSRLLKRIQDNHLVIASGALAGLATAWLLASTSARSAAAAVALTGFAYAAIYPTVLAMAGDRFPRFAGTVFSVLFSIALIGGMSFPWSAGQLAEAYGYRAGMAVPLVGAAGVTLFALIILRHAPVEKVSSSGSQGPG